MINIWDTEELRLAREAWVWDAVNNFFAQSNEENN